MLNIYITYIVLFIFGIQLLKAQENIVINELQVWSLNDAYGEAFSEYIELTNPGTDTVSLDNWIIQTNSGSAVITGLTIETLQIQ